jgi:hypothetical protein
VFGQQSCPKWAGSLQAEIRPHQTLPKLAREQPSTPERMNKPDRLTDNEFAAAAFIVNRYLMDHMRRLVRDLDVDFESVYIWGLLAHLDYVRLKATSTDEAGLASLASLEEPILEKGIRVSELAQISGLPRETVRRKLIGLAEKNHVRPTQSGGWIANRHHSEEVKAFTLGTIERFVAAADELQSAMTVSAPKK